MLGRMNPVARLFRSLFGISPSSTLNPSGAAADGGRRMGRRIVLLAVAAGIVGGIAFALYELRSPTREHVEEPIVPPSTSDLPTPQEFERLARENPVSMLEACLVRYERDGVKGFTATLEKVERVKGTLHERERIQVMGAGEMPEHPGEHPKIRVRMIWEAGFRSVLGVKNLASLYVWGENDNQMKTLTSLGISKSFDPKDSMPRGASRYAITDAGLYRGMLRTYDSWKKKEADGRLHASLLGIQNPPEAGGRSCYVVRRNCPSPEVDPFALDEPQDPKADPNRDGAVEVTVYVDVEHWLQVGTVLKRADGSILAEYWFRDVKLVYQPFEPNPFTMDAVRAAVKK